MNHTFAMNQNQNMQQSNNSMNQSIATSQTHKHIEQVFQKRMMEITKETLWKQHMAKKQQISIGGKNILRNTSYSAIHTFNSRL